jgi:RND superfamily putative drug exporter
MTMFGRISRFCFRHRLLVVAIWVIAVGGGVVASGPVFQALSDDSNSHFESTDGRDVLNAARKDGDEVVAVVDHVNPNAPATRTAITSAAAYIAKQNSVLSVDYPYAGTPGSDAFISRDRQAVLIVAHLKKDLDQDVEDPIVDKLTARMQAIDQDLPAAKIELGGDPLLDREINGQVEKDLSTAEYISLPLTLLFMVVVFGGFVAAGLPVLGAIASVGTALVGLWGFSTFASLDSSTLTVTTLLGMGLSIDYGLLVVSRYKEELAALVADKENAKIDLATREEAVRRTGATAGRTVAFSALTVAASFAGLVAVQMPFMQAIGAAGISIAVVTALSAITLIPALLRLSGRRIKPAKRASNHRTAGSTVIAADHGFFSRLAGWVQRHPVPVLIGALGILLIAAVPVLSTKLTDPGLSGIPTSIESRRVVDVLSERFGHQEDPAITVVARTDAKTLTAWGARHTHDDGITGVTPVEQVSPGLTMLQFTVSGDPQGSHARDLVGELRADRPSGGQSWVTGSTAYAHDELALLRRDLPVTLAIVVLAMAVLLFLMTGSVIVPLKALVMNMLSMGATFGAMVAAFQWGWGAGPLDLLTNAGMDPAVLVVVFAFAFGLSMDYETFLLARIKEAYDSGLPNDTAVRVGLQRSGRIITSAAIAMVIVFGCFVAGKIGTVEEIGLGLVVAVLIDATIVRCLLVPAVMTLLGRANWWAPKPLRSLHARFGLREGTVEPVPPTTEEERVLVGSQH